MSIAPELIIVCQKMLKDGKSISVGLLKAKAPKNYPLKEIISAVQYCKTQPDMVLQQEVTEKTEPEQQNEEQELMQLRRKVQELETRLSRVETQLAKLSQ